MRERRIEVQPMAGALGVELSGVDVSNPLEPARVAEIRDALVRNGVVVLRDQKLSREAQLRFARQLGEPEVHPIANGMAEHPEIIRVLKPAGERAFFGTSWHTDNSFFEKPTSFTILYAEAVPPVGGDTLFASMEKAYEALSPPIQRLLEPLRAVHSASSAYDPRTTGDAKYRGETPITYRYSDAIYDEVEHPVVRTHPETGRRSLYVNAMFTQRIVGLAPHESRALLEMLYAHAARPEFSCRLRWTAGALALWDNRSVQHYAIDDYAAFERVMYRVTLAGTRPVGAASEPASRA
ncbi:MAG TPA: TauD/TfdA family dioxygenase [Candidatus Acidoferrales bacterium]|nr:TauD/TfdA family dioxygenase [Candidatus Acidoferrales bacterium]